jgi:hypothetical protein
MCVSAQDHPATQLFPNLTEWFSFLHAAKLKTYFNDHPFPVGMQTSASEVAFRWNGLSEWMQRGLDFWWFDHNCASAFCLYILLHTHIHHRFMHVSESFVFGTSFHSIRRL